MTDATAARTEASHGRVRRRPALALRRGPARPRERFPDAARLAFSARAAGAGVREGGASKAFIRVLLVLFGLAVGAGPSVAQHLRMAVLGDISVDPHYLFLTSNVGANKHIFSALTEVGPNEGGVVPDLAASWRLVDDRTWEFELRPGVTFHDGTPVEAEDVAASIRRVRNLPNNPAPYTGNLRTVTAVEVTGPLRLRILTDQPNPLIPAQLTNIMVVPRRFETATTDDFRSGRALIGSGPYRFVSFTANDRLELVRNDTYFRERSHWAQVTIRIIPNDLTRVSALLAGDVDLIDFVPVSTALRLQQDPRIAVHTGPSGRILFFQFDLGRAVTPGVRGPNGEPLERNPFQDPRVRRAISLAINREGLVRQVMEGFGIPTSQFAVPAFLGYDPSIPLERPDIARARALLREAGYPNGFTLTLNCPNNRYANDATVCEAVGQMLARIGIRPNVETQPMAVFYPRITRREGPQASAWMLGLTSGMSGEAQSIPLVFRSNDQHGRGQFNYSGYSDPVLDAEIDAALSTMDRDQRGRRLQAIMRRATELDLTLPLFGYTVIVATRPDLVYPTSVEEHTLAVRVRPR